MFSWDHLFALPVSPECMSLLFHCPVIFRASFRCFYTHLSARSVSTSIWTRVLREESLGVGTALTQNAKFTYDQATFIRVMINSKAQATKGIPELSKNSPEKTYAHISQIFKIKNMIYSIFKFLGDLK